MIPVALNLFNKQVLIVGGGNVAFRKARLFLNEAAKVTMVSIDFLDDWMELEAKIIVDSYQKKYLKNQFLVYACTNDPLVNQQIVDDCNACGILCGSATRAKGVTFNSMAFEKTDVGMVALSTHQKMPYTKPLLEELTDVLKKHQPQLELLGNIRQYLVSTQQVNRDLMQTLYEVKHEVLVFLNEAIACQRGYIFVYHQSDYPQSYQFDLKPSLILSLKEFEELQSIFVNGIDFTVIPLLLSDGYIYRKLKKMTKLSVKEPLIRSIDDVKEIIRLSRKEGKTNYWLMHPRSQNELLETFKACVSKQDVVQTFDQPLCLVGKQNLHVIPLLMSEGRHYHDLICQIPNGVTVSKILPLETLVNEYMIKRNSRD